MIQRTYTQIVCATLFVAAISPALRAQPATAPERASAPPGREAVDIAVGKRIYRDGLLPSGQLLKAIQLNGQPAALVACAACHKRSGAGSSEGGRVVPAITGPVLFAPGSRAETARAAYSDATLVQALRTGLDPSGRELDPLMPRYELDDASARELVAYLRTMGGEMSPGVDDRAIHFGVVAGADVDPKEAKDMLDIVNGYAESVNSEVSLRSRRARGQTHSRLGAYRRFRHWQIDVWKLEGDPATWRAQLDRLYDAQPVFALLSGKTGASWSPVHRFCEDREIPCVLPNTELPAVVTDSFYNVYFSRGAALDGAVLARYLADGPAKSQGATDGRATRARAARTALPVLQVYSPESAEQGTAARELRERLKDGGRRRTEDSPASPAQSALASFWREKLDGRRYSAVVLWGGRPPFDAMAAAAARDLPPIYVALQEDILPPTVPERLKGQVFGIHPYALPAQIDTRLAATRVWLRNRRLEWKLTALQANTFFAVSLAGDAMSRAAGVFSREALIEQIEAGVDIDPVNPPYRRLSFGPGEHYGSKGAYVVALPAHAWERNGMTGDWVVP